LRYAEISNGQQSRFCFDFYRKGCDDLIRRQKYRRFLWVLLIVSMMGTGVYAYYTMYNSIPDEINVYAGDEDQLENIFSSKLITYDDALTVTGNNSYLLECKLFNIIPLKTIKVQNINLQSVQVSGDTVGIYMETNGVLIIDTGEVAAMDGINTRPAENIVRPGDYIMAVNGTALNSKQELVDFVNHSDGSTMELDVIRHDENIKISLDPVLTQDDTYKLGVWVRDNIQGIGTLTYVDSNGTFGALGHGISDMDTGGLLSLKKGELYQADILAITKGEQGSPGELRGVINYQNSKLLGDIEVNQSNGIRGVLSEKGKEKINAVTFPIGLKQEIQIGPAVILCNIDGAVKEYQIEITDIDWNQKDTNKSFSIQVTDPDLLAATGGIVQGMSGSPIIQNGKLIGAVTHVLIQDASRGYGIFIENMMEL